MEKQVLENQKIKWIPIPKSNFNTTSRGLQSFMSPLNTQNIHIKKF